MHLVISDSGAGGQPNENKSGMQGRGIGLSNTIERLRVLYGRDHRFVVHLPPEGGCRIEIESPYKEERAIGRMLGRIQIVQRK
jgi:LytS/YehU family sensor histidine kinase